MTNVLTKESQTFPCGQWLAKDEGDGSLCRTLSPLESTARNRSKQMMNRENPIKSKNSLIIIQYDAIQLYSVLSSKVLIRPYYRPSMALAFAIYRHLRDFKKKFHTVIFRYIYISEICIYRDL